MDVSKNSAAPKWMVKIMENPIKLDDLRGKPTIFGNTQINGTKKKLRPTIFHQNVSRTSDPLGILDPISSMGLVYLQYLHEWLIFHGKFRYINVGEYTIFPWIRHGIFRFLRYGYVTPENLRSVLRGKAQHGRLWRGRFLDASCYNCITHDGSIGLVYLPTSHENHKNQPFMWVFP